MKHRSGARRHRARAYVFEDCGLEIWRYSARLRRAIQMSVAPERDTNSRRAPIGHDRWVHRIENGKRASLWIKAVDGSAGWRLSTKFLANSAVTLRGAVDVSSVKCQAAGRLGAVSSASSEGIQKRDRR